MESLDILEKLGKVAGIAGIAVGALVLIFSGIIQKNIFPNLSKEHGFRIIRMIIVAASVIAVIGIVAWIYSDIQKNKKEKDDKLVMRVIEGIVTDANGYPVVSCKVSFAQMDDISDRTDADGKFHLEVDGTGKKYYDLVFTHPQFTVIRKKITINFDEGEDEIPFGKVALNTLLPPDPEPIHRQQSDGNSAMPPSGVNQVNQANGASITLYYDPEDHFCNLDVNINIGGVTFYPQTNPVVFSGLRTGSQNYYVSGKAYCSDGQCDVQTVTSDFVNIMNMGNPQSADFFRFFYQVNIVNGGTYYLVFDKEYCIVGLLDPSTYNILKAASY